MDRFRSEDMRFGVGGLLFYVKVYYFYYIYNIALNRNITFFYFF